MLLVIIGTTLALWVYAPPAPYSPIPPISQTATSSSHLSPAPQPFADTAPVTPPIKAPVEHKQIAGTEVTATNIIILVNNERIDAGLPSLHIDARLTTAAFAKALDMVMRNYFSHTTPDGVRPWEAIQAAGYNYLWAGENLAGPADTPAGGSFTSAQAVVTAWMNSPEHRANILKPEYRDTGVAAVQSDRGFFIVEEFATRV